MKFIVSRFQGLDGGREVRSRRVRCLHVLLVWRRLRGVTAWETMRGWPRCPLTNCRGCMTYYLRVIYEKNEAGELENVVDVVNIISVRI